MNAFVLAAFKKFGGAPAPLVGLFTSDEEIGSPACRPIIEAEARRARAVFNSEPGRPSGNVVTGRKGGVFMKMEIAGKAAHSGGNFTDGICGDRGTGAQDHRAARDHRPDQGHDRQCRARSPAGRPSTPSRRGRNARSTCATSRRPTARTRWARSTRIVETANVPGTSATLEIAGEFKPLVEGAGQQAPVRALCGLRQRPRPQGRRRVHRRLRGFRLHGGRRHADHLRGRSGRRQGAHAGGISGGRTRSSRARRRWRWRWRG